MKKLAWFALGTSLSGLLVAACTDYTTDYMDYLRATGKVTAFDGQTSIANLPIEIYDWVVTYTDGSTVAVPFQPVPATDLTGRFAFDSAELALQSGNLAESCTRVCTQTSRDYESVCTQWASDDEDDGSGGSDDGDDGDDGDDEYCSNWATDSDGNEYCSSWSSNSIGLRSYCVDWEQREYSYCSQYGQDCSYYYPSRNVKDITSAYAEITYSVGASRATTQSQFSTSAAEGVQSSSTTANSNTTVTAYWNQDDVFVTPLTPAVLANASKAQAGSNASPTLLLNKKQAAIVAAHNAARHKVRARGPGVPRFGRTHAPAVLVKEADLNKDQMIKIQAARQAHGATPIKN